MKRSAMICVAMLVALVVGIACESTAVAGYGSSYNSCSAPRQGLFARCRARRAARKCCTPAPTCCETAPTCCEPAPVCEPAPAPVCCPEPAPVCCEAPAATCCDTGRKCCKRQGLCARRRARRSCNTGCCGSTVSYAQPAVSGCSGCGAVPVEAGVEGVLEEAPAVDAPVEEAPAADVVPDAPVTSGSET